MIIVRQPFIDWEPLQLRFVAQNRQLSPIEITNLVRKWSARQGRKRRQELKYVHAIDDENGVIVHSEGFTEESFEQCLAYLAGHLDDNVSVHVGSALNSKRSTPKRRSRQYLEIPPKLVRLENGHSVEVGSFKITRYPVSVTQFDAFVDATQYRTSCEVRGEYATFRSNNLINFSDLDRTALPATCVSWADASAYCQWSQERLPTEAEWLAAAVLDWQSNEREPSEDEWEQYLSRTDTIRVRSAEWTADTRANRALVRSGPHYVLTPGWMKRQWKTLQPLDYADVSLTFRMCAI